MEQEETRAIRTPEFLLMRRYGPTPYNFKDELYDLVCTVDYDIPLIHDRTFLRKTEHGS